MPGWCVGSINSILHSGLLERAERLSVNSPTWQVGDTSRQPTSKQPGDLSGNPPTGRLGIFHASLHRNSPETSPVIPQPGGWGYFTPAYSGTAQRLSGNPPTGRLGIFHASLHRNSPETSPVIPQPGGWGYFTPAYIGLTGASPVIPQPGGWGYFTPAYIETARRPLR